MTEFVTDPMPGLPGPPPYTDDMVRGLPLQHARQELLEEIMSTPATRTAAIPAARSDTTRRTRWLVVAASAAAAALVVTGPVWLAARNGGQQSPSSASNPSADLRPAGSPAESPLVLIDAPGWRVTRVYGFGAANGEMTFRNGTQELQVNWRPAAYYDQYLGDRADGTNEEPVELLGKPSTMFTYADGDYTTIRPVEGKSFLEVRGRVGDRSAYLAVLDHLVVTDRGTWLAAMPPEVVLPDEEAHTVRQMLDGVPTPPGFDVSTIPTQVGDRYDFGAGVAGTVTCAWIERWQQSTRAGDESAATAAVDALQSSKQWPILLEMAKKGEYPDVVWQMADEVNAGHTPAGYQDGLGCN